MDNHVEEVSRHLRNFVSEKKIWDVRVDGAVTTNGYLHQPIDRVKVLRPPASLNRFLIPKSLNE